MSALITISFFVYARQEREEASGDLLYFFKIKLFNQGSVHRSCSLPGPGFSAGIYFYKPLFDSHA